MKRGRRLNSDVHVVGGLHRDDFDWASKEYEEVGWVLVGFVMDVDNYHWKAIYANADALQGPSRFGGYPPSPYDMMALLQTAFSLRGSGRAGQPFMKGCRRRGKTADGE